MSISAPPSAQKGRRLALVVGVNGSPTFQKASLRYAASDAEEIAEVLQQQCEFELLAPPLLDEHATSATIKTTLIKRTRDLGEDDFLLLYFAGHGHAQYIEGGRLEIYLVTADFDVRDVEQDETLHLSMRWLRDQLFVRTKVGRVLVILDCCYAGGIDKAAPDHYLDELRQRWAYFFETPGGEVEMLRSGMRWALAATEYHQSAHEQDGHGVLTGEVLRALRGEVDVVLGNEGQVTIHRLFEYLYDAMPAEQKPLVSGSDAVGRPCVLAWHGERVRELPRQSGSPPIADHPDNYLPFSRNTAFQPRSGEFERLERLLFGNETEQATTRVGLVGVGVTGLGGIGKTQLAEELAYRYRERFPGGIFWMAATGTTLADWHRDFAELAGRTGYLPGDDETSNPEHQLRRAQHFCRYLARHADALLILDNVEDPEVALRVLPILAGSDVNCTILYTSRNTKTPFGVTPYPVEKLSPRSALRLLLTGRPHLLTSSEQKYRGAEENAAFAVCHLVGYLPLALKLLRDLLMRDQHLTLVSLAEGFNQYSPLEITGIASGKTDVLTATFELSWKQVHSEEAKRLLKLASYFPEATPIPLWLLGLATGLSERAEPWLPLGKALMQLQEWSLVERLSGEQIRLHPLIRDFGRHLLTEDGVQGKQMLSEAGECLLNALTDLDRLEERAKLHGYHACLEQVQAAYDFVQQLGMGQHTGMVQVVRWMGCEEYLLGDRQWWPEKIAGLFYQQLYNRAVEEGHVLQRRIATTRWLRQINQVGAGDRSLLRIYAGHAHVVTSVAFSPDGKQILTGSIDGTARLWETSSGTQLVTYSGHSGSVRDAAFSPDGKQILTGSADGTARLWEASSGRQMATYFDQLSQINRVSFSSDGAIVVTCCVDKVYFWCASEASVGKLLGMYIATYKVDAIYWQDRYHLLLADTGGPHFRPHVYQLVLEGEW